MRYRFDGKQKMIGLGVFPEVPLAMARARRDKTRTLLADGVDPSHRKKIDKIIAAVAAANTFGAVVEWGVTEKHIYMKWVEKYHKNANDSFSTEYEYQLHAVTFLDPFFWQAPGKAKGFEKSPKSRYEYDIYGSEYKTLSEQANAESETYPWWHYQMHRFIQR